MFEVDGVGLTVESLTGGHGMSEMGASCTCSCCGDRPCACGASGSCAQL
ncbi:thiomuracin/GE37468 family thiazolyl RiPP peptide [Dactylosporangium sp. NPDC051541]